MSEDLKVQTAPQRAKYQDADYFVEEVRDIGAEVDPASSTRAATTCAPPWTPSCRPPPAWR